MLLAEKNEEQLKYLDEVINKEEFWIKDKFRVMNNEAGSGKSQQTFRSIAKLALNTDKTIIYVQMFANKNSKEDDEEELKNAVAKINKNANKEVANYLCKNNNKDQEKIRREYQVICITHTRYEELCKGKKNNFVSSADVLIIDEFPNLYRSFSVSESDLADLNGFSVIFPDKKEDIEKIISFLNDRLNGLYNQYSDTQMHIVSLHKLDIKKYIKILNKIITSATQKDKKTYHDRIETATKILELFKHSSVFSVVKKGRNNSAALYSFYSDVDYVLAKENNIILDANGGFDERYKLRKQLFLIDRQSKVFDYDDSIINFYPVSTTKSALKNYKDIVQNIVDYIENHEKCIKVNKHLIITDLERENRITKLQNEVRNSNISIAHYGALLGKNDWDNYNNAWIIKTPFYSWVDYILQYMFYSGKNLNGHFDCSTLMRKGKHNTYLIFHNDEFNKFKNSIVKGEIYQALKRIARKGEKCTFNILIADEDIYKSLKKEFLHINENINTDFGLDKKHEHKKKPGRKPIKTKKENDEIKVSLIKAKIEGKDKIKKSEICQIIDIRKDKLSKHIKQLEPWLLENNMKNGNGKDKDCIILDA